MMAAARLSLPLSTVFVHACAFTEESAIFRRRAIHEEARPETKHGDNAGRPAWTICPFGEFMKNALRGNPDNICAKGAF